MKKTCLLFLIPLLFFISCKEKYETINKDIIGCTVTFKSDISGYKDFYLDSENSKLFDSNFVIEGTILGQVENALEIQFTENSKNKTGWFDVSDVYLTDEIFKKCIDACLDGNTDAEIIIKGDYSADDTYKKEVLNNLEHVLFYSDYTIVNNLSYSKNEHEMCVYSAIYTLFLNSNFTSLTDYTTNALHLCAPYCNDIILSILVNSTTNLDFPDYRDENGLSYLMLAIKGNNLRGIEYFSKIYGINPYQKDKYGKTVAEYISESSNSDIKNMLFLYSKNTLDYIQDTKKYLAEKKNSDEYIQNLHLLDDISCIMLRQLPFKEGQKYTVIKETEFEFPKNNNSILKPQNEVTILYAFDEIYSDLDIYDDGYPRSRYYTTYGYYMVKDENGNIGILNGKYLAHDEVFYIYNETYYASYKFIENKNNHFLDGYSFDYDGIRFYSDLYVKSNLDYKMHKILTGKLEDNEFTREPLYIFETPSYKSLEDFNEKTISYFVNGVSEPEPFVVNEFNKATEEMERYKYYLYPIVTSYEKNPTEEYTEFLLLRRDDGLMYISYDEVYKSSAGWNILEFRNYKESDFPVVLIERYITKNDEFPSDRFLLVLNPDTLKYERREDKTFIKR